MGVFFANDIDEVLFTSVQYLTFGAGTNSGPDNLLSLNSLENYSQCSSDSHSTVLLETYTPSIKTIELSVWNYNATQSTYST